MNQSSSNTFPNLDAWPKQVNRQAVTFPNLAWDNAADLYLPPDFDESRTYPAIVCAGPISSCKEQAGGLYAALLAETGYVTLIFDPSFQGASGGAPRYLELPSQRVADLSRAADYLDTLSFVDSARMGVLGMCGGGGYAAKAAQTERRFKAVGLVVPANYGRVMREGNLTPGWAVNMLDKISAQTTAEAKGAVPLITSYIPASLEDAKAAGITDVDILQAIEYYRLSPNKSEYSPNKLRFTSMREAFGWDAFHLADPLLTQPLQIIVGAVPGAFGSYRDGFALLDTAASPERDLTVLPNTTHYDLYWKKPCVEQALAKLTAFYSKHL